MFGALDLENQKFKSSCPRHGAGALGRRPPGEAAPPPHGAQGGRATCLTLCWDRNRPQRLWGPPCSLRPARAPRPKLPQASPELGLPRDTCRRRRRGGERCARGGRWAGRAGRRTAPGVSRVFQALRSCWAPRTAAPPGGPTGGTCSAWRQTAHSLSEPAPGGGLCCVMLAGQGRGLPASPSAGSRGEGSGPLGGGHLGQLLGQRQQLSDSRRGIS